MTRIANRLALAAAVSALALTGTAAAQQTQPPPQQGRQQAQQTQQSSMEYRQVRGTIVDAKRVNLRNSDKQAVLVLLETRNGQRTVVDLGTERIGIRLREGTELAVRGRPVTVGSQRVILQANAVNYEGRGYDVNRPASRQGGSAQQASNRQNQQNRQQAANQGGGSFNLASFDMDGDSRLNRREMTNALFARWDSNGDKSLSVREWNRAADRAFGEQGINLDVQTWDPNKDGTISRGEFRRAIRQSGLFARIDQNGDATVSQGEFRTALASGGTGGGTQAARYQEIGTALYDSMDRNSDNRLTQAEYESDADTLFDGEDHFADWDADASGWLDEDEFTSGVEEAGLFGDWDMNADGLISADEWNTAGYDSDGLFGDDSGMLGENDSLFGEDEGAL
ncbi:EF-hand domain-containing protein [Indioceanicola profundi]|uniref:EF-hand domain-containing protein n=1 Tax=Indioceanicola profundi TaxID=2220096 RepID=UPI000E6ABEAE|nr:hypothetical protein [Indioceanicola profundi]